MGGASCEGASRWAARERRVRAPEQREIFIVRLRSGCKLAQTSRRQTFSALSSPRGFGKEWRVLVGRRIKFFLFNLFIPAFP